MRKFVFAAVAAIVAGAMTSCNNGTPSAKLRTEIDTVSYSIGMAQSDGLKQYLAMQQGVDTTYMAAFIKGVTEGANAGDNKKQAAYFAGIQIGQQIANQWVNGINYQLFDGDSTQTVSLQNLLAGFISGATGKGGKMTIEEARANMDRLMSSIRAKSMEKTYGPNKEEGEKFLAENAKKDGVKVLPSGVQYKVIKEGSGKIPADSSLVKVNYEGKLLDGTVFDSSYKRGQPAEMRCNQVIKGWTDALVHMPTGSIWEVYIPQELAYGERATGQIKPFSMLTFKIELLEVK